MFAAGMAGTVIMLSYLQLSHMICFARCWIVADYALSIREETDKSAVEQGEELAKLVYQSMESYTSTKL